MTFRCHDYLNKLRAYQMSKRIDETKTLLFERVCCWLLDKKVDLKNNYLTKQLSDKTIQPQFYKLKRIF